MGAHRTPCRFASEGTLQERSWGNAPGKWPWEAVGPAATGQGLVRSVFIRSARPRGDTFRLWHGEGVVRAIFRVTRSRFWLC